MSQVRYVQLRAAVPKVVPLDNNVEYFQVTVRNPGGTTLEFTLDDPQDFVAPNTYTRAPALISAPAAVVNWQAAPAAVDGVVKFDFPVAALRFTNAADAIATVLQQGAR